MLVIQALFAMSRPLQLISIALVYLLGTIIAVEHGVSMDTTAFVWGLSVLLPVSASVHYANEYADHETDALTTRTPFSGGSGALSRTGLSASLALQAAWVSLILGISFALILLMIDHLPLEAFGVLALGAFGGTVTGQKKCGIVDYGQVLEMNPAL